MHVCVSCTENIVTGLACFEFSRESNENIRDSIYLVLTEQTASTQMPSVPRDVVQGVPGDACRDPWTLTSPFGPVALHVSRH